jgi:hypothetical protein
MTEVEFNALAEELAAELTKVLAANILPLRQELAQTKAALAALQERPGMSYCGVWKSGAEYNVGDATTFSGSLWICREPHISSGPVADHRYWQLAVKRGTR